MSGPLPDTWAWRDLPVLRAAVAGVDAEPIAGIRLNEVSGATGLSAEDVYRAAKALQGAGLIGMVEYAAPTDHSRVNEVAGAARVYAGQWPSEETAFDRMIAALTAIAENTEEPDDTRGRARKILDNLAGAGRDIGIAVAAAAITGQLPGAGS